MPLKDGVYEIRFVPRGIQPPFFGGVYATGGLLNAPIRAEALQPHEKQRWQIEHVTPNEEKNLYRITYPSFPEPDTGVQGVGPVLPGFGLRIQIPFPHEEPIILTVDVKEFLIRIIDEKNLVGNITATGAPPGVAQAIDEDSHKHILFLGSFPEIEPFYLPRWQFIPVKN